MKLQFLGAARQVTGSQHYLRADGIGILVDCGIFQERAHLGRNWEPSPIRPGDLDALLLTHAHLDHCGLAPKLVREGFHGPDHPYSVLQARLARPWHTYSGANLKGVESGVLQGELQADQLAL